MKKVSVVISTYNSEKYLTQALESVKWVDEIVVVDDGSTDQTVAIAKKYTKIIFHHKSVGYVEPVRNFAINKATGDWVLIVDADETIPDSLAKKLRQIVDEEENITHVLLPRKNIIFGKWIQHTGWWPDHLIRFFKKGKVQWKNEIHSVPEVTGEPLTLTGEAYAIVHQNYETVLQFIKKNFENYTLQEAKDLQKSGYTFSYIDAIRFPAREFLRRYFAWQGYKDGFHGLVLSLLMAMYHFIIFLHLWESKQFPSAENKELEKTFNAEIKSIRKEFNFWFAKAKIDSAKTPLHKIMLQIKEKIF